MNMIRGITQRLLVSTIYVSAWQDLATSEYLPLISYYSRVQKCTTGVSYSKVFSQAMYSSCSTRPTCELSSKFLEAQRVIIRAVSYAKTPLV